jgi:hypothetical protein
MKSNLMQWLGFEVDQYKLAIPLGLVASVFYSPPNTEIQKNPYGLEVHEGAPIFLLPPERLLVWGFEHSRSLLQNRILPWVIVLKTNEDASVGFRVEKTFGPFESPLNMDRSVHYGDQELIAVNPVEELNV